MTDFQMSLIGASTVFVAGVFAYNKWQERKARKSVERVQPRMIIGPAAQR